MPLHAALKAALLFVPLLALSQQPVPLIGIAVADDSPVQHGCTPTGNIIRGSTHWFDHFHQLWNPGAYTPDLPAVQCPTQPVEIVSKAVEWEAVGNGRFYFIRIHLRVNTDGLGSFTLSGTGGGAPCHFSFRGHPTPGWKLRPDAGQVIDFQCGGLGNKLYPDAEALVSERLPHVRACRVVFADVHGPKGRLHQTWYNHNEPICGEMRAIDPLLFCKTVNQTWEYPHAVRAEDICDGIYPRKNT